MLKGWFQNGSNTQIFMSIQVQLFFTIWEWFVIMEPYPFPNQAFRLSTMLSTFSSNHYIHTCFPILDSPVPSGIPLRVSGNFWTQNPSPSPTWTLWMTGMLANTSKKHHSNIYAKTRYYLPRQPTGNSLCRFSYTACPALQAWAVLLEVLGLHCGEGETPHPIEWWSRFL